MFLHVSEPGLSVTGDSSAGARSPGAALCHAALCDLEQNMKLLGFSVSSLK